MGVSEIGFPQNVVYKQRIQTSDTLPVTIGASKYCEFLFDIDAGDRMTPLGIVGWGCDDKTQVFLLDFYMDNDLQTAKLILKNPYATTIAINSLYIDVLYSKQGLDMSEVDVVDNLTTDSAIAALSARQGKLLNDAINGFTLVKVQIQIPQIPANSTYYINLSSYVPSGKYVHAISSVHLGQYVLPYFDAGMSTSTYAEMYTNNTLRIKNTASAWNNYVLYTVLFCL